MLNRRSSKFRRYTILIIFLIVLPVSCLILQNYSRLGKMNDSLSNFSNDSLSWNAVFDDNEIILIEDSIINETIFIMENAEVTLINTTVEDSIYLFNAGILNIQLRSGINGNIIISDFSTVNIYNSSIDGNIECRDSSSLNVLSSQTDSTIIWKFDSSNLMITNSSLFQLNEFGIAGQIIILDSLINNVILNGLSSSLVFINNSNILFLNDLAKPINYITGPTMFNLLGDDITYQTSERSIILTWMGWDSPIIDGYLNINFQILVDSQFYSEINGSGFYNNYVGSLQINFTSTGPHNISLISIDNFGNNFTSTITIRIIEYPSFDWNSFGIGVGILITITLISVLFLHHKQNRGYFSSIGIIFKKELSENKTKITIFTIIGVVPGFLLNLIFRMMNRLLGGISIDQIRIIINMFLSYYLLYFGVAFSIAFASSSVIGEKKNGTLSWFFSKPVRRWEYLWGKLFAYLFIIILIMIPSSISFALSGILLIDPIYISDLFSIGGFIFLIGIITLIPLLAIGFLCSTLFKKTGLAIFIPILLLMLVPSFVSFLPILFRHEWPLLLSYSYYFEQLGRLWISNTGGGLSTILSPYSMLLGFDITPINLSPINIVLILSSITIFCLVISTFYFQKIDIV
ncbi:MAG: ABC transporter permease [Promethearchaeota archaeon]